jgi:DNA-binding transcriptional LysR family regulator
MELRHLRSFVAVADELHFTRAAERLHIAQSPLSQHIRRLERELGTRLFDRDHHSVDLTPAGRAMLDHARAAVRHADDAAHAARLAAAGRAGTLAVGFLASAALELLPRILPSFRAHAPGVGLRLTEATSAQQLERLRGGRLDVAFTRPPADSHDLATEVIWSEPIVVALPAGHARGAKARLRLAELDGEPLVLFPRESAPRFHDAIIAACHEAGFSPRVVQEAVAMPTIVSLVAAGIGAALVPRSMSQLAPAAVTYHDLARTSLRAEIAMVTHVDNDSALVDAFTAHARHALADGSATGRRRRQR